MTLHGQQRVEGNEAPLHGRRSLLPFVHVLFKACACVGTAGGGVRRPRSNMPQVVMPAIMNHSPRRNALSIIAYLNTQHSGDRLHRLTPQSARVVSCAADLLFPIWMTAFGAQRKHVTLSTDFRSSLKNGHSR